MGAQAFLLILPSKQLFKIKYCILNALCSCHFLGAVAIPIAEFEFGRGNGPIFMDDVKCRGLEPILLGCSHRGLEVHDCSHFEDAGVRCVEGTC